MNYDQMQAAVNNLPGDGTTDATSGLNNLFSLAAADGVEVVLPAGQTYACEGVVAPAGLRVRGGATLRLKAAATGPMLVVNGDGVVLHGGLSLDGNKTSQSGQRADNWTSSARIPVILCDGHDYLTVDSCNINNAYQGALVTAGGVGHRIVNNRCEGNVGNAIQLYYNSNLTTPVGPRRAIVSGNYVVNCHNDVDGTGPWGNGILVSISQWCDVIDNDVSVCDRTGIKIENPIGCNVQRNRVDNVQWQGIAVQTWGQSVRCVANKCTNTGDSGIYLSGSSSGIIQDVVCAENVLLDCGADLTHSTPHGITLGAVVGGVLFDNIVRGAYQFGIYVSGEPDLFSNEVDIHDGQVTDCSGVASIHVRSDRARFVSVRGVRYARNSLNFLCSRPQGQEPQADQGLYHNGVLV